MSDYLEQPLEQPMSGDPAVRKAFSQEASCCRGSSCQTSPVDSAFVGQNGDLQIVNNHVHPPAKDESHVHPPAKDDSHVHPLVTDESHVHPPAKDDSHVHPPAKDDSHVHPLVTDESHVHPPAKDDSHVHPPAKDDSRVHPLVTDESHVHPPAKDDSHVHPLVTDESHVHPAFEETLKSAFHHTVTNKEEYKRALYDAAAAHKPVVMMFGHRNDAESQQVVENSILQAKAIDTRAVFVFVDLDMVDPNSPVGKYGQYIEQTFGTPMTLVFTQQQGDTQTPVVPEAPSFWQTGHVDAQKLSRGIVQAKQIQDLRGDIKIPGQQGGSDCCSGDQQPQDNHLQAVNNQHSPGYHNRTSLPHATIDSISQQHSHNYLQYHSRYGVDHSGYYNRPSVPHVINDVINPHHSYQPYGGGHSGYYNRPSVPHVINDVINPHHSYRPYGGGHSGYYNRPSVPHVINDVINQNHSGYYQPYGGGHGGSWNSGYNHRPSLPHGSGHGRRHR
ncbi:MAG: thioredoxin family protein [Candidatus Obscuribacterales bacterium]|nr:thioredoxin family protein [Candidatus Obscuribacterales bacterium]